MDKRVLIEEEEERNKGVGSANAEKSGMKGRAEELNFHCFTRKEREKAIWRVAK